MSVVQRTAVNHKVKDWALNCSVDKTPKPEISWFVREGPFIIRVSM